MASRQPAKARTRAVAAVPGPGRPDRGPQDLQAVHRRGVPAHGERPLVRRLRRRRSAARQRLPRVPQGPARCRAGRPQGVPGLGRPDRDEPRPDPVPRGRADGGPARPVRRRGHRRGGPVGGQGDGGRGPRHRPLGLVRRLGRQDRPGPRVVQPGRRAVLQLHDPGTDRRRRRRGAGDVLAAGAREPARAAARLGQHGRAGDVRDAAAARR